MRVLRLRLSRDLGLPKPPMLMCALIYHKATYIVTSLGSYWYIIGSLLGHHYTRSIFQLGVYVTKVPADEEEGHLFQKVWFFIRLSSPFLLKLIFDQPWVYLGKIVYHNMFSTLIVFELYGTQYWVPYFFCISVSAHLNPLVRGGLRPSQVLLQNCRTFCLFEFNWWLLRSTNWS